MNTQLIVLGVIAAIILLTFFIVIKLTRKTTIKKLVYERSFSERGLFEGETVIMTERIYNPSFLPVFRVDMEYYVFDELKIEGYDPNKKSSMQHCISRFSLLPFMQTERTHVIHCKKRGYYTLDSAFVFFKEDNIYFNSPCELYVYPSRLELGAYPSPQNFTQGDSPTKMPLILDPFSFDGVRKYVFGDPFNSINFKQTAKQGELMVNNREYSSSRVFKIYINFDSEGLFDLTTKEYEEMMEQALSLSAYLLDEALHFGYKIGLSANCMLADGRMKLESELSAGEEHFRGLLEEMAMMRARAGVSFSSLLKNGVKTSERMSEIFIFTAELTEAMEEYVYDMRRLGNSVNVVLLRPKENDDE